MGQNRLSIGDVTKPVAEKLARPVNPRMTSILALHGGPRCVRCKPSPVLPLEPAELKSALANLIDAGIFSDVSENGPIATAEREFANYIGVPYALSFSSGTAALYAAYAAADVGPGDEVLHPCYSWISSIAPALHRGAQPTFCEVEQHSLLLDHRDVETRITPRTKVLSLVHMHGNVCNAESINIARRRGLLVIEDCSHCHGALCQGRRCGSIGDIGCFSLQGAPLDGKPVAAGEGGFAVTRSRSLYERMLLNGHINRFPTHGSFERPELDALTPLNLGLKLRAHPWAMACASLMLRSLDNVNERKRQIRQVVVDGLNGIDALHMTDTAPGSVPGGFYGGLNLVYRPQHAHYTPVELVRKALQAEGVIVGEAPYRLLHQLPFFANADLRRAVGLISRTGTVPPPALPNSESVHGRIINVLHPLSIELEDPYIGQMVHAFMKVFAHIEKHGGLKE